MDKRCGFGFFTAVLGDSARSTASLKFVKRFYGIMASCVHITCLTQEARFKSLNLLCLCLWPRCLENQGQSGFLGLSKIVHLWKERPDFSHLLRDLHTKQWLPSCCCSLALLTQLRRPPVQNSDSRKSLHSSHGPWRHNINELQGGPLKL